MFRRLIHMRGYHNHTKNIPTNSYVVFRNIIRDPDKRRLSGSSLNTYSSNLLCKKIAENQLNKMTKLQMENEKLKKRITKIDDDLDTLNLAVMCLIFPMSIFACFK